MGFVALEQRQIIVDRHTADGYIEEVVTRGRIVSAILTGFWVDVDWLWTAPLSNRVTCLQDILDGIT